MREYEQLAAAIVLRAVVDYDNACKVLNNDKSSNELKVGAEKRIASIENFIKSPWYTELSSIPQHMMLDRLAKIKSGELELPNRKQRGVD